MAIVPIKRIDGDGNRGAAKAGAQRTYVEVKGDADPLDTLIAEEMCVRDLADTVRGRLVLGIMPPIGGELEPVKRIVADVDDVQQGDVFLELGSPEAAQWRWAEQAFARGALGVVAERHVEPWAGKFTIKVDDAIDAMSALVFWLQKQTETAAACWPSLCEKRERA